VLDAESVAMLFSEFNAILGADGLPADTAYLPEFTQVGERQMAVRLGRIAEVEKVLVALVDEVPAGLSCVRLVPYIGQDVPYAEITQLYVRERFQRRGVGAALVAASEDQARRAGATCMHIITGRDNKSAQAFYASQGYGAPCVEFEKHFPTGVIS
jgi:GNAT superfamily N-acetyltransferase